MTTVLFFSVFYEATMTLHYETFLRCVVRFRKIASCRLCFFLLLGHHTRQKKVSPRRDQRKPKSGKITSNDNNNSFIQWLQIIIEIVNDSFSEKFDDWCEQSAMTHEEMRIVMYDVSLPSDVLWYTK